MRTNALMKTSGLKAGLWRWGPALLLMVMIFAASSIPKEKLPDLGLWNWLATKSAHMLEYGLLALAYLRGLTNGQKATRRQVLLAICLVGLYGASDEYHQSFVPGRGPAATDVLIDMLGATIGLGIRLRREKSVNGSPGE